MQSFMNLVERQPSLAVKGGIGQPAAESLETLYDHRRVT